MVNFNLEEYVEDLILGLFNYACTGVRDPNFDSGIYNLYENTITATINYADRTQTARVNILSPELSTICLIVYAVHKTAANTVTLNKNALTADPKILGLLSEQFGFDKLATFGLSEQRILLNTIGDLYKRKGTSVKLSELLQQLKLNNTKIFEYYIRNDSGQLDLIATDKYGNIDRQISYMDTTVADNNWFLSDTEVNDILAENNDIIKSPYFSIESELEYSNDSPANWAGAVISSLIKRDLLIQSNLAASYESIRIINDTLLTQNISFLELVYTVSIMFSQLNNHNLIPPQTAFLMNGWNTNYFTDPTVALADVFNPDAGLLDAIETDYNSVQSTSRDPVVRRTLLDLKSTLFYEPKFISGGSSNEPTFDSDSKLFNANPTFKLALDTIIANPGSETIETIYSHYIQLLSSYLSVAYRNSGITNAFSVDDVNESILDLIEYVSPMYTTFIGASTVLSFSLFPDDVVPLKEDENNPSGPTGLFFSVIDEVPLDELICQWVYWEEDGTDNQITIIDDSFEIVQSWFYTFEVPLEEIVCQWVYWEECENYVHPITYDKLDLEYDDFPAFNVRRGLMDEAIIDLDYNDEDSLVFSDSFSITIQP